MSLTTTATATIISAILVYSSSLGLISSYRLYKRCDSCIKDDYGDKPALRYSTLPCPNGCFLSGLRLAILVPIIVIIEDRTSLRLLTASRVIAIELVKVLLPP